MLMWISSNYYIFAIPYNEGYTATFLPPPHPAPDTKVQTNYTFVAHEIATKWKLTSTDAPYLLEQQFYKVNDYNPNTDFLHFDHIPKTGGTSISDLLRDTLGKSYILPGSERSGAFNYKVMNTTILLSTPKEEYPYIVSYAHERLRPIHGQNRTKLAKLFENYFALPNNKCRLRQLTVLREPMDLRASKHAMALCSINGRVNSFNRKRKQNGLEPICTPEQGLNISSLWDEVVDKAMDKCASNGTIPTDIKSDKYDRALCRRGKHVYDICRGSTDLLATEYYRKGMRSLLRGIMGRYTAQQKLDKSVDHYYHRHTPIEDGYAVKDGHGQLRYTLEKIEEYTLIDLGSLDMNIMHTPYQGYEKRMRQLRNTTYSETIITSNDIVEPDFVWFGITERMDESMCLLYYTLNVKPLPQPPKERVMNCSPTSWWTEADRDKVKEMEPADYTIWRTANAMLDIRVMKMKEDIKAKLNSEDNLTQKEIDLNRAFVDAGCLE